MDNFRKNHKEFIKNKELISKSQQRSKGKKCNVFTEKVNKIPLSAIDDKIIQWIDSTESYVYGTNEEILHKKEEIKCNNIIAIQKMINYDNVTKEDINKHSLNWSWIPDY